MTCHFHWQLSTHTHTHLCSQWIIFKSRLCRVTNISGSRRSSLIDGGGNAMAIATKPIIFEFELSGAELGLRNISDLMWATIFTTRYPLDLKCWQPRLVKVDFIRMQNCLSRVSLALVTVMWLFPFEYWFPPSDSFDALDETLAGGNGDVIRWWLLLGATGLRPTNAPS